MRIHLFHGIGADLRLGVRRLAATPQFFVFAVLSIAVGIAVTTSAYSVLNSLTTPIHAADPDRTLFVTSAASSRRARISQPDFEDVKRTQQSFRRIAASTSFYQTLVEPSRSELVFGEAVSGDYFATLGLRMERGRAIQSMDDAQGTTSVPDPSKFMVTFDKSGQAFLQLDCNRGKGSYTTSTSGDGSEGKLEFGPIATTMMMCPQPSLDQQVGKALADVRTYMFKDDQLHMSKVADGGILSWKRA